MSPADAPQAQRPPSRRPPQAFKRGIRFQLSTLLLLSSLNAVALAGAVIVLFLTLTNGVLTQQTAIQGGISLVTGIHTDLVTEGDLAEDVPSRLDYVAELLSDLPPDGTDLTLALNSYRREAKAWQGYIAAQRAKGLMDAPFEAEGDEGEVTQRPVSVHLASLSISQGEAQVKLKALTMAHRILVGEISILSGRGRPQWLQHIIPWGRWFMAWIFLMTLVTIVMAIRIRKILSEPLETLTHLTAAVAGGDLDRAIPAMATWRGAPEILALSRSIEAMRLRLVSTIETVDARRAELKAVLNSLDEGVLVLNVDGEIVEFNPRALNCVTERVSGGLPPRRGRPLKAVFPKLEEGNIILGEAIPITFTLRGGQERHLSLRIHHLKGSATRERDAIAVVRDVTESFEVEGMKRDFLSVVTHELKTPLTAIEGYAKLLAMGKGGGLSERQKGFADVINTQTQILKEMIQTLLDITRLEGGNLHLELESIDAGEALREAVNAMGGEAERLEIALSAEAEALRGVQIQVDPLRLRQILGNLVGNALKFTEGGGSITLKGSIEGEVVKMIVQDTGRGIPEAALPHLFEKFYQVAQADTRNRGGAGLGLYICHQLAHAHGGDLQATSKVGAGSQFILTLPRASTGPTPNPDNVPGAVLGNVPDNDADNAERADG